MTPEELRELYYYSGHHDKAFDLAVAEIEQLEHAKQNLHSHIKRLEDKLSEAEGGRQKLRASLAKARGALEEAKWVARSALKGDLAEAREALDRIVRLYNYESYEEALLYADDIVNAALKGEGSQFPDAGKMVDLSGKIAPEGGELMKSLEDRAAAHFAGRCDLYYEDDAELDRRAAARLRELEAKLAEANQENQFNYEQLCAVRDQLSATQEKLEAAEKELDRYQRCYWANEGKYEALIAQVAKLREALEKIRTHHWCEIEIEKIACSALQKEGDDELQQRADISREEWSRGE